MKTLYKDITLPYETGIDDLIGLLDSVKGMYMASGTDYPGRYSRWDIGFVAPPVEVTGYASRVEFKALNLRGEKMLDIFAAFFAAKPDTAFTVQREDEAILTCVIVPTGKVFSEEERSRQPSPFSPLRQIIDGMQSAEGDSFAGFYGAFKYDLLFCFNPIPLRHARDEDNSLFRLFIPDRIYVVDRRKETAFHRDYDFEFGADTTKDTMRRPVKETGAVLSSVSVTDISSNVTDGEYADMVAKAQERIHKGDVFEVVLSRQFTAPVPGPVSGMFRRIRQINPSPYEFLMQMADEQLVGASPEMFVRVEGVRVETCPIAGTARRSNTAGQAAIIEDAKILQDLIESAKDEAELTMCTDVDRNDKARICEPGSVRLLGRRQIEKYAGLFHTVDHVEGMLRDGFSGVDAFLSHMWAVTLTGAPKPEATKIIEESEPEARAYYGGAVGALMFNGGVNTGITIRTLHIKDNVVAYQAGASLVYDSVPEDEAAETHTKATSFKRVLSGDLAAKKEYQAEKTGVGKTVVLIDNEDSFVHTLADYIRQTGAEAVTYRHGVDMNVILQHKPHLVVHSPGPGLPEKFRVSDMVKLCAEKGIPQFGVCLGLQGMFEAFGGTLAYLQSPHHGKTWNMTHQGHALFEKVATPCPVGAYHSIYGDKETLPDELDVIAANENGVIMALAHKDLPIWAVQFHPESILSMSGYAGNQMISNVMKYLAGDAA